MQTFLPDSSFAISASYLDRQRLGKQRVECLQILKVLTAEMTPPDPENPPRLGWANHPAVRMWRGYADALLLYSYAVCKRWTDQGYKDTCWAKMQALLPNADLTAALMPPWLGAPDFHLSHQSNLIRKLPEHYSKFWPGVPDDLPYVWPVA